MIDRVDNHPTPRDYNNFEQRSGKDRRKIHTMLDPAKDRRKGDRRKKTIEKKHHLLRQSKPAERQ